MSYHVLLGRLRHYKKGWFLWDEFMFLYLIYIHIRIIHLNCCFGKSVCPGKNERFLHIFRWLQYYKESGYNLQLDVTCVSDRALSHAFEDLLQWILHFAYWCHENLFHAGCLHPFALRYLSLNVFMIWGCTIRSNFRLVSSL